MVIDLGDIMSAPGHGRVRGQHFEELVGSGERRTWDRIDDASKPRRR